MKPESLRTKLFRIGINLYPMFFGTGGKVLHIARDWKYIRVQLKLGLWTRNYVGTIFGGSQFAATDPMYMVMMFNIFGGEYVVWDKAATIQFKKPGRGKLIAEFSFSDEELQEVKQITDREGRYEFKKSTSWIDEKGEVVSTIEKSLYIATKEHYRKRQEEKKKSALE